MTISEKVQPEKLSASILLRLDGRLAIFYKYI